MGCAVQKFSPDSSLIISQKRKILLLGPALVGKTSILHRLMNSENISQKSLTQSVGIEDFYLDYSGDKNKKTEKQKEKNNKGAWIQVWDLAGRGRALWGHYWEGIEGVIYVVDVSQDMQQQVFFLSFLYDQVNNDVEFLCDNINSQSLPVLFYLNKQDVKSNFEFDLEFVENYLEVDTVI